MSPADDARAGILALLEPEVVAALDNRDVALSPHQLERLAHYSQAVSARRQADALERLAVAFEYNHGSYNFFDAVKERS